MNYQESTQYSHFIVNLSYEGSDNEVDDMLKSVRESFERVMQELVGDGKGVLKGFDIDGDDGVLSV